MIKIWHCRKIMSLTQFFVAVHTTAGTQGMLAHPLCDLSQISRGWVKGGGFSPSLANYAFWFSEIWRRTSFLSTSDS